MLIFLFAAAMNEAAIGGARAETGLCQPSGARTGALAPPLLAPRRYRATSSDMTVSDIILHRGPRPENAAAFDARAVHANLAGRISRPH